MRPSGSGPARSAVLHRLLPVYLVLALWFAGVFARLVYLQGFQGHLLREKAVGQQHGFVRVRSERGEIYDRNLDPLAVSVRADTISVQLDQLEDPEEAARRLAPVLELPVRTLQHKLGGTAGTIHLKRKVTPQVSLEVRSLGLAGVFIEPEIRRVYLNQGLAAHVLGFVGIDNQGLGGLEYEYNDQLQGRESTLNFELDAKRERIRSLSGREETRGDVLVLTLDRSIQYLAEQVLESTVAETKARAAAAVVMDPHTGQVLAMASWPSFNPNRAADYPPEAKRNRAILQVYEPGSTFKLVTLASVLNEGLSYLNEVIDCRVGTARLGSKVYREAKRSFEDLTFTEVLAKSSNVGTVKLGIRLGEERLFDYIRRFGFGEETGIELPGEEAGLLRPPSQWSTLSIGALSIGQELAVTPLQMVRAAAVFANGGYLIRPHIVARVMTPDGDLVSESEVEQQRLLPASTIDKITQALSTVVEDGTGGAAQLNGYTVAGKTGTAQKIVNGEYSKERFIASFLGFAPLSDPRLVTLVIIDEPRGHYYGGEVAAPAFREIMERALIHLRVPHDLPVRTTPANLAEDGRFLEPGAAADLSLAEDRSLMRAGLDSVLASVLDDTPTSRSGPVVTHEIDTLQLPDFSGLSLKDVAMRSSRLGIRVRFTGQGVAVSQRPAPGRAVMKDTICEVFFSTQGPATVEADSTSRRRH